MRRTATRRHYLMIEPTFFDIEYSTNPPTDPQRPTSAKLVLDQWAWLRKLYLDLGHQVELIDPRSGLPDMVFASNAAMVVNGQVLVARFRHAHRATESAVYLAWFRSRGYRQIRQAKWINEGGRDHLYAGSRFLAGSGLRPGTHAHAEMHAYFGLPVIGLTLVDPSYYHLDTALAVLDETTVMYYPGAFSPESCRLLEQLYPDAITVADEDAARFGLNAVSDGRHVVLPEGATGLSAQLRGRGFEPIGADVSELLGAGGAVKSCTLELHDG